MADGCSMVDGSASIVRAEAVDNEADVARYAGVGD